MGIADYIPIAVVITAAAVAAVTDVWRFKVYNVLTFPLFLSGLVFHGWTDGWSGLGFSIAGAAFGFGTLIALYVLGGVGAGDVKLLSGIGAWLGVHLTLQIFLVAGLAIGVYSVFVLAFRSGIRNVITDLAIAVHQAKNLTVHLRSDEKIEEVVERKDRRRRLVPVAAMVALGVVVVFTRHWFAIDWFAAHALK